MAGCEWTETCTFFSEESGYSPVLQGEMQLHYCLCATEDCARLRAMSLLPEDAIPHDLLPSELERLDALVTAHRESVTGL